MVPQITEWCDGNQRAWKDEDRLYEWLSQLAPPLLNAFRISPLSIRFAVDSVFNEQAAERSELTTTRNTGCLQIGD
jgi:hypothetical protein